MSYEPSTVYLVTARGAETPDPSNVFVHFENAQDYASDLREDTANHPVEINELDLDEVAARDVFDDVPEWFCDAEGDGPTLSDVAVVAEGGCESGAWMAAVTYHTAMQLMSEHGDDVIAYLLEVGLAWHDEEPTSWSGLACTLLSSAVDSWCSSAWWEFCERD